MSMFLNLVIKAFAENFNFFCAISVVLRISVMQLTFEETLYKLVATW
jgi:hypothetical protein